MAAETQTVDLADGLVAAALEVYLTTNAAGAERDVAMHSALEAVAPLLIADALDKAAEDISIPGASSLTAAWLQGRASRYRGDAS